MKHELPSNSQGGNDWNVLYKNAHTCATLQCSNVRGVDGKKKKINHLSFYKRIFVANVVQHKSPLMKHKNDSFW